jgi:hypothetical protein
MHSLRNVAGLALITGGLASAVPSGVDKRTTDGVSTQLSRFVGRSISDRHYRFISARELIGVVLVNTTLTHSVNVTL